jgi:FkbM family methyltransferase
MPPTAPVAQLSGGFSDDELRRIELTAAVRDTDRIPKVADAGSTRILDGVAVQVMHCGVVVVRDCYYGPWMTEVIRRLRGHHEPQEEAVFYELLKRLGSDPWEPTMLELGSYWAYYALWFKHVHPRGTCILVEPDPQHLEVGERNLALNAVDGQFIEAAVSYSHDSHTSLRCESDGVTRRVPTVSVDGLLAGDPSGRADLVVCDVQGAEMDVLRGASHALREGRIRFLVVSTHLVAHDPVLHQRCLAFLVEAGAQIIAEHSIPESCSGDGLIVASMDPRDKDFIVDVTVGRARDSLAGEVEWRLAAMQGWGGLARILGRPLMKWERLRVVVSGVRTLAIMFRAGRWSRVRDLAMHTGKKGER